jgi:hypothetical protein
VQTTIKAKLDQAEAEVHPLEVWESLRAEERIKCGQTLSSSNLNVSILECHIDIASISGLRADLRFS